MLYEVRFVAGNERGCGLVYTSTPLTLVGNKLHNYRCGCIDKIFTLLHT